jgi:hypothetical protein
MRNHNNDLVYGKIYFRRYFRGQDGNCCVIKFNEQNERLYIHRVDEYVFKMTRDGLVSKQGVPKHSLFVFIFDF